MFGVLTTLMVIVMLVLGGGGTTVAAAQSSQPYQPLYAVKLWSEDIRLQLAANPQAELQLALEFTARRAEEVRNMIQGGSVPPESVQARYQDEVEQVIRIAAGFPDGQALLALEQVRSRLQTQQQALLQVQTNGSPQAEASLLRSREMLRERLQWVEDGLKDPAQLRDQLRQRDQLRERDRLMTSTPPDQATQAGQPGAGDGNPWTTGTPTPGSSYGPGGGNPWTTGTPTPGSGYGPGGGNPWTTGTPTPGSGYGPGPGPDPSRTCTPGSGAGPQPTQHQENQPTLAGPQPTQKGPGPLSTQAPTSNPPGPQPTSRPTNPGGGH